MVQHSDIDHNGIPGVGGATTTKLVGTSAISSTSFSDVPGMSFALDAASVYIAEYWIGFDTNNVSVGIKLAFNAAEAGTSIHHMSNVMTSAPANAITTAGGFVFAKDTPAFAVTSGPGGTRSWAVLVALVTTTTNADTLQLRHASETATLTTVHNGWARLTKMS